MDPNDHDVFILRQRFRLVVNVYEFSLPCGRPDGRGALPLRKAEAFQVQRGYSIFCRQGSHPAVLRIQALQRFDPRARYNVTLADGTMVGQIQKVFGQSLLRSTYRIYDAAGAETALVTEENAAVALLRRAVGFVPYLADISNWLPIPYHFTFLRGGQVLGSYRRHLFKIQDAYTLDLTHDPERTLDRRLVLAMAVGMDALQAR